MPIVLERHTKLKSNERHVKHSRVKVVHLMLRLKVPVRAKLIKVR